MIVRHHHSSTARSTATYSRCGLYRYDLTRVWDRAAARLLIVMLNPSTATEATNDPTVERCERRARALGFGAFRVMNLFAWRDTAPAAMRRAADPVGPANDARLTAAATGWIRSGGDAILCGWGTHGAHLDRGRAVTGLLRATGRPLRTLGLTQGGHPRHPLYVAYAQAPLDWAAS